MAGEYPVRAAFCLCVSSRPEKLPSDKKTRCGGSSDWATPRTAISAQLIINRLDTTQSTRVHSHAWSAAGEIASRRPKVFTRRRVLGGASRPFFVNSHIGRNCKSAVSLAIGEACNWTCVDCAVSSRFIISWAEIDVPEVKKIFDNTNLVLSEISISCRHSRHRSTCTLGLWQVKLRFRTKKCSRVDGYWGGAVVFAWRAA